MVKPAENKDDKNPNGKKAIELSPTMITLISNGVMLAVMIIGLFVTYLLIDSSVSKKIAEIAPNDEQSEVEEDGETRHEGILVDLGEFVLNLSDPNARRYLKVGIAMEISKTPEEIEAIEAAAHAPAGGGGHGGHGGGAPAPDPNADIAAAMERFKPAIRDAVISVLSAKMADELSSQTGKEIAKEEIVEMVNNIFEGKREVMRVSFGQFIIQ